MQALFTTILLLVMEYSGHLPQLLWILASMCDTTYHYDREMQGRMRKTPIWKGKVPTTEIGV